MDDTGNVVTHIEGAHAILSDGKGHSGYFVTMGTGAMVNVSKKLGVDTVSSTETKIVETCFYQLKLDNESNPLPVMLADTIVS